MRFSSFFCIVYFVGFATSVAAIDFDVRFVDPPGQGFHSTEPFSGHGGNQATTLGEARKNVLFRAVDMVRSQVYGSGTIVWEVQFQEIEGYGALTLGPSFSELTHLPSSDENISGFDFEVGRHYPSTLMLALTNKQRSFGDENDADAETLFSEYGSYYGYDADDVRHSFLAVVLHELVHVLGFTDLKCLTNCIPEPSSQKTHFSRLVYGESNPVDEMSIDEMLPFYVSGNKLWFKGSEATKQAAVSNLTGGHTDGKLHLHAELPYTGQNGSHFAPHMYPAQLMYSAGANTTEFGMAAYVLCDIGWCAGTGKVQDLAVMLELDPGFSNEPTTVTGYLLNSSNSLLRKPELELNIPANIELSNLPTDCSLNQTLLRCSYDSITEGQKQEFSFTLTAASGTYHLYGRAYARDYIVDPNGANNIIDITFDITERLPLTLSVGSDLEVAPNAEVTLTATASGGTSPYQYEWQQLSGPEVSLELNDNTARFRAPSVSTTTELVFRGQVSDGQNTQTDELKVTVIVPVTPIESEQKSSAGAFSSLSILLLGFFVVFTRRKRSMHYR
ncbi:hypothetical protein QWY20_17840 [Alkalimonas sp. MEB108]|uniref:Ig-like domain-containing protein n=1 Tax=Alkalimonas cellulosilytica TaxID=3058395 RepID=A0ABU7JAE9_9GAMM|nr:hypothetical protein [Alkalimonas sp. MEB108]MEE2003317.1 hypothetical protein [Alkalimonas sp. MEB108]